MDGGTAVFKLTSGADFNLDSVMQLVERGGPAFEATDEVEWVADDVPKAIFQTVSSSTARTAPFEVQLVLQRQTSSGIDVVRAWF